MERALAILLDAARAALGPTLRSAVLYGSAAEGRLRASSDVNLILVLEAFEPARVDGMREALRVAGAAADVRVMYLLASEIPAAMERFASKFADVLHRRRVLLGPDPFAGAAVPRAREVERLRTEAFHLVLRLRAACASRSLREDQAARALADLAGPLRGVAFALLDVEGRPAASPREALAAVAAAEGPDAAAAVARVSTAREAGHLPGGAGPAALPGLLGLAERMRARAAAVRQVPPCPPSPSISGGRGSSRSTPRSPSRCGSGWRGSAGSWSRDRRRASTCRTRTPWRASAPDRRRRSGSPCSLSSTGATSSRRRTRSACTRAPTRARSGARWNAPSSRPSGPAPARGDGGSPTPRSARRRDAWRPTSGAADSCPTGPRRPSARASWRRASSRSAASAASRSPWACRGIVRCRSS